MQEVSLLLLQLSVVSPMIASSEIGADLRCKAASKTRIRRRRRPRPLTRCQRTGPGPGAQLLKGVGGVRGAVDVFRPFTAVVRPEEAPTLQSPAPATGSDRRERVGGAVGAKARRCAAEICRCRRFSSGIALAVSRFAVCRRCHLGAQRGRRGGRCVDRTGEQVTAPQPVAAGPAKVSLNDPRLEEVTAPPELPSGAAAAGALMATRSIAGRDSSDSTTAIL